MIDKQEIATFFLIMFLLQVVKGRLEKHTKEKDSFLYRQLIIFILAIYFTGVCHYTLLHRDVTVEMKYELSLFWSYQYVIVNNSKEIFFEVLYNILLLLPMGILLPFYLKVFGRFYPTIIIGFLFSCLIEISQLFFHIGLFEFDDLFHNTLGVCIGYSLYYISLCIRKRMNAKRWKLKLVLFVVLDIVVMIYFERLWLMISNL